MYYKVSEPSLKKLRDAKVAEDELTSLKPLVNKEFVTEAELARRSRRFRQSS
jgi:hypothetical protein